MAKGARGLLTDRSLNLSVQITNARLKSAGVTIAGDMQVKHRTVAPGRALPLRQVRRLAGIKEKSK